jgi:hypothetical protein
MTEEEAKKETDTTKGTSQLALDMKAPPPVEYTTKRGRAFVFGKPALKHRGIITKVLKLMAAQTADYNGIIECAKKRGMTMEQFLKLDETDLTEDEMRAIMKKSDLLNNMDFAETMNDVLTEALYATIKKAPFLFDTMKDFEDKMDDYGEAVELFPYAIKWIAQSAQELSKVNKKN